MMKNRILSLTAMLLCLATAWAEGFTVDGIKYNITSTTDLTVKVTSGGEYWGEIVIPASVQNNGKTYSVTSIGNYAFSNCWSLTSVTIPNSVTSIGNDAFYRCSGLTSVTIPSSVTSIGGSAFSDCSGLTSITIPNSVTNIGDLAFVGCSGLTSIVVEAGNTVYDSREGCNAIIKTRNDNLIVGCNNTTIPNSVTSIGDYAFYECNLTSVPIPNSVTSIGNNAFSNCWSLTSVTIPNSVTSIGANAFSGCYDLTSVTIPNSVTSIGVNPFAGCSFLAFIFVEEGNTVYDSREGCNAIIKTSDKKMIAGCRYTIIPNGVTSIGDNAFEGCRGLVSITIPSSVTNIGRYAFYGCSSLTSITIPNSVTSIGSGAFQGTAWFDNQSDGVVYAGKVAYTYKGKMPANTSIVLDEGTLGIGEGAFNGRSGLISIIIPNSVTSIEGEAFWGCSGLTSITIPNSVTSIGGNAFRGCSGLTSITIPNSVTSIGGCAFAWCSSLTSISIPSSVTTIGSFAFHGCSGLTSITIPNSVTSIGNNAFEDCNGLTCVKVQLENPLEIRSDVFPNRTNATLYVPYSSKAAYEAADYWKEFKEIKEVEGMIDVSILDDALYADDVTVYPDGATCFPILMKNKESITNIQFDVVLPEGVTIQNSTLTNRKGSDHTITTSNVNGATRFMVTSMGGKVFSDNDGAVINLSLAIDKNLAAGHQEITLRNITLSTSGAVKVNTPTCMAVLTVSDIESGDADGDGVTDVNDVTSTINHILKKPVANFVRGAADVDGDSIIDVNDVQAIIDKALGKTSSSRGKNRQDEEPALDPQ